MTIFERITKTNLYRIYCPECSVKNDKPTASLHHVYDKVYKKDKFYLKCNKCKLVTPAYENDKEIFEHWDYYFTKKEDKLFDDDED